MYDDKKILAIIPARGGSKGIHRKNIRDLCGKPLIAWTIEEAKKSKYIDTCIVSTEDEEIKKIAENYGGTVPFLRPAELARDDTPGVEPVLHAIDQLPGYDYIVLLQPTSPLRIVEDIDGAVEFCLKQQSNSCVSVTEPDHSPYWMYTLEEKGAMTPILKISPDKSYRRQLLPKVYMLNGAVYVAECNSIKKNRSFITVDTLGYIMPKERSLDIDTMLDFKLVEFFIKERGILTHE